MVNISKDTNLYRFEFIFWCINLQYFNILILVKPDDLCIISSLVVKSDPEQT